MVFSGLALVANAAKLNGWKAFVLMLALLWEVVAVAAIAPLHLADARLTRSLQRRNQHS